MSKYGYLREALIQRGLMTQNSYIAPAPFGRSHLTLAHSEAYVERAFNLALTPEEIRRIGLPCTERVIRRSRYSSAGTTLAAWLALEHGIACNAAGGSHHASFDSGAGFCVFNDVAVAARNLIAQGVPGPFLIIDADVHQGDGTADIFQDDPAVFTFSIHATHNYPFRRSQSDMDVELEDDTDGATYLGLLGSELEAALASVEPRLIFYNAGVDVHVDDRLGRLALTADDIRLRDRTVLQMARTRDIPIACVIGGGYSRDPLHLAALHAILFEEASRALL